MARDLKNNLFDAFYYESFLPPLWQTVFHEANRANHILFPDADGTVAMPALTEADEERITEAVVDILTSHDVTRMRSIIGELKGYERQVLFRLYLRFLARYRAHFKSRLN